MPSHGCADFLSVDQLLTSIQTKDGIFFEPPRRVLIESPTWGTRCALTLRLLHGWARGPPWPKRGTPVAVAIYAPIAQCTKGLDAYVARELIIKNSKYRFSNSLSGRDFQRAWDTLAALGPKLLFVLNDSDHLATTTSGSNEGSRRKMPHDIRELLAGRLFPEARVIVIGAAASSGIGGGPSVLHHHHQHHQHQQSHHLHAAHHHPTAHHRDLLPLIQRHVTHKGLTWGRSAALLGGGEWGAPNCLLDAVQHSPSLRNIARTPFGCLALASIYLNASGGDSGGADDASTVASALPSEEIDVVEAVVSCVTAGISVSQKAALGRLALFYLKAKRSSVTAAEIRLYGAGGNSGSGTVGCFERIPAIGGGRTGRAQPTNTIYTPICAGIMEYLAANYLATLTQRPGLLSAEITGLSPTDEIEPHMLQVLTFAMRLLGTRAHILLSRLTPLWLSPQNVFALALAGGDSTPNTNTLCDLLGISRTPKVCPLLESNPIWVQCRSTTAELLGWAMALRSPACRLTNLELNYQIDKHTAHAAASRLAVDTFLSALAANGSVATLRITSLIETDVLDADIQQLAQCVARAMLKPRLVYFELIVTLLEDDPPALKLQPVVTALCRVLPRQPSLRTIHLDLGLCSSQIIELCATLEQPHRGGIDGPDCGGGVRHVALPHLRCECGSVAAIARLLALRQLASLALPFCWGAAAAAGGGSTGTGVVGRVGRGDVDPPSSSSGVSMGSSGSAASSSTGTSGLIKQSSITSGQHVALISPNKTYATGGNTAFCSLPRGRANVVTASAVYSRPMPAQQMMMGRSATLPRQPLDGHAPYKQRSYDSVVSKMMWPPSTTASLAAGGGGGGGSDVGGVLHDVLMAARAPDSRLAALDLSKAQLTGEDAACLGETVRQSGTLHSVRLEGAARLSEILPAMLGVGESQSVQMLVLASPRLAVDDAAVVLASRALMCCHTLRLLVLDGWSFRMDNEATMSAIRASLSYTMIREVSLNNCRVYLSSGALEAEDATRLESASIVVLKLAGIQIITPDNMFRGPQIISHLSGFTALRDLDLSAPSRTGLAVSASPLIIDDKSLLLFFNTLHCHFKQLVTLKLCNWILHLDDATRTLSALTKCLRHSTLKHIKADGISVLNRPRKVRVEHLFLNAFLAALRRLRWLEISLAGKRDEQIVAIGESIMRMQCDVIDIKISDSSIEHARLLAQTVGSSGKFDIGVSTFGTSSGILVHVEKVSAYKRSSRIS